MTTAPVSLTGPTLATERLVLRVPQAIDWPLWRDFAASDRARFVGGPLDESKAWRAFGHIVGHWVARGYGSFVFTAKDTDTALGMTGPWHPIDWPEQELGWTVWSKAVEGTGLAYEAALAARNFAFTMLGWETAVSYIDPDNARSIALAERLGAIRDPDADAPGDGDDFVYRHPTPEVSS